MYIYESHLGGFYVTKDEIEPEWLHCDQCGDSDWPIGCAETKEEAFKLITDWFDMKEKKDKDDVGKYLNRIWKEA